MKRDGCVSHGCAGVGPENPQETDPASNVSWTGNVLEEETKRFVPALGGKKLQQDGGIIFQ